MRNVKNLILTGGVILALSITGLTGCHMGGRTAGRALDDTTTTASVKHRLNSETEYKFDNVDVKTFAGVVQLSGFVSSEEQKERAGQIAQSVEGVERVDNKISIQPMPIPTGRSSEPYQAPPPER